MPQILRNFDWPLFTATLLLIALGLISLWSVASGWFFYRQIIWTAIGVALLIIFASIDYRILRNHSGVVLSVLAFGVMLLVSLLLFGPETRGVTSWFRIGSVAFEPSEFIKLALVIILAKYFSVRHTEISQIRHLFISGLYAFVPAVLVLIQPDLGSAVIIALLWAIIVTLAGINMKHLAVFCAIFAVLAAIGWFFLLAPYQIERISVFLDPNRDPEGVGFHAIQSLIAVGSGQLVGKGIGYGTQSHLNFLPEAETDFIFAAIAEETGFIGITILILLFAFFLWRVLKIGLEAKGNFSKLFALGFSALLFLQFLVHSGANIGLLPITGVTLPLISYGGSSLVTLMIGVGILESIRVHSRSDLNDIMEEA